MDALLDPLKKEDETTIQRLAAEHAVIAVPWHKTDQHIPLGTTFHSSRSKNIDPWASQSPFERPGRPSSIFSSTQSSGGFYKSSNTSRSTAKLDHMSIGGGVTVDCKFASASVFGSYDKSVSENGDSRKASVHARERHGSIILENMLRLTNEAQTILQSAEGLSKFEARYGDYVLTAYSIGADTGMLLSENRQSDSESEAKNLTVTVEVLGIEESKTTKEFFSRASASSELHLQAFDTLENDHVDCNTDRVDPNEKQRLVERSTRVAVLAMQLSRRVHQQVERHGLRDGTLCTDELCRQLAQSGLIIELILRPVSRMREVVEHCAKGLSVQPPVTQQTTVHG